MPLKTPEQIAAEEEAASKEHREELARQANKKRNDAALEARNAIADSADSIKTEEDELEPLTDEVWDQEDRPDQRRRTRAEAIADQDDAEERERRAAAGEESEDEAAAALLRNREREEDELDEARQAGAADSRRNAAGVVEYRIEVAGEEKWLTLSQLRSAAGGESEESDAGQRRREGVTNAATRGPSPEALEAQRLADEQQRKTEKDARKAKLKDLLLKASMGDEEAIDQLADMQAEDSRVTPEALNRMVDERVDARVEGKTSFDRAVHWFESEEGFAHELKAPGFKTKAAEIDRRLAQEHPEWNPRRRLEATGNELRKELKELRSFLGAPAAGARRPAEPQSRLDRKRQASGAEVPRAQGRARSEGEPDEVETTADAIQALARSRGQQRPISH